MQKISIAFGLKVPDTEARLAAKPHRWKKMRLLHKAFFKALMNLVTEYEKKMIKLLDLPGIDDIRLAQLNLIDHGGGKFFFTREMNDGLVRLVSEWMSRLFDEDGQHEPVFVSYAKKAFYIGAEEAARGVTKAELPRKDFEGLKVDFQRDPNERYLQFMIDHAGERIRTEIGRRRLDELRKILIEMAQNGEWPISVGQRLHDIMGEGSAAYWLRIARSEAVLAANAAYDAMADANGIKYDTWSAAPTACEICLFFHNKTWRRNEGPEPVTNTHPHCLCARIPSYSARGEVQGKWDRPSPYDVPYTAEELAQMARGEMPGIQPPAITPQPEPALLEDILPTI